jgi:hypothetical protein
MLKFQARTFSLQNDIPWWCLITTERKLQKRNIIYSNDKNVKHFYYLFIFIKLMFNVELKFEKLILH